MTPRDWVNTTYGRIASWRARRRSYSARTLLVPNHWNGSVQHFYHFLLGYLMPVSLWVLRHPKTPVTLRDCGPMQPWLDLASERADIELISPGHALHVLAGDHMANKVIEGMDNPSTFRRSRLLQGTSALRQLLGQPAGTQRMYNEVIVIDRATSEDFYQGGGSETQMSGSRRRSIPNLSSISDFVAGAQVTDLARVAPTEQIRLVERAGLLVGQHGAGLTHMLWMPPGSTVLEIAPPLPPEVENLFMSLALALGHRYVRVPQDTVHSSIDIEQLAEAIQKFRPPRVSAQ